MTLSNKNENLYMDNKKNVESLDIILGKQLNQFNRYTKLEYLANHLR